MKLYQNYAELPEGQKEAFFHNLVGMESTSAFKGFRCPSTNVGLYGSCGLKKCYYYVDNSLARNCVLFHMHREGCTQLTPRDVSFLFQIPIEEVSMVYEEQINKIRRRCLQAKLESENRVTLIEGLPVCCVCNHKTNSQIFRNGLTYCGKECISEKPPFVFALEKKFGSDIVTILTTCLKLFKSAPIIEKVLAVKRRKLEFAIYKFLPDMFDRLLAISSQSELFGSRNRKSKICKVMLNRLYHMKRQFGTPTLSMRGFRDEAMKQLLSTS